MYKPNIILVTGTPASGKTTLSRILSEELGFPVLSRDKLKEGMLNTLRKEHNQVPGSTDLVVNEAFFDTIKLWINRGISLIVEAAFQDRIWRPRLLEISTFAVIKIVIRESNKQVLKRRFTHRHIEDPLRQKYHGDKTFDSSNSFAKLVDNYESVNFDAPTLRVNTTDNYTPSLSDIIIFATPNSFDSDSSVSW